MKILIVGAGWTGRKVYNELNKHKLDKCILANHDKVIESLAICNFDWIINCAGVTGFPNVDACEDNQWTTYEGNTIFPIHLREYISYTATKFAHFSSGCIYEGQIDSVDASPNFFGSTYSISKGISDSYLKDNSVVFRIRMPFTNVNEPKNYLTKVKNYAENGYLYNGGQNSFTNHDEAVKVAIELILSNTKNGAYNLVNSGSVDLSWIVSKMKLSKEPNWIPLNDFNKITKCRRSNCVIPAFESMSNVNESLERAIYEGGF